MNTKKKILMALALVGCAVLLVVGSIAGTLAYLTAKTETITNTFTVGNVAITMDETDVNEYGVSDGANRVTSNSTYKLIPGHTYVKDPIIHVTAGSEACYLFVKVENGLADIDGGSINTQLTANGWVNIADTNVWYKASAVDARTAAVDVTVFGTFTIVENADLDGNPTDYTTKQINVTAYAIQADGFADVNAAWEAAKTAFGIS